MCVHVCVTRVQLLWVKGPRAAAQLRHHGSATPGTSHSQSHSAGGAATKTAPGPDAGGAARGNGSTVQEADGDALNAPAGTPSKANGVHATNAGRAARGHPKGARRAAPESPENTREELAAGHFSQ